MRAKLAPGERIALTADKRQGATPHSGGDDPTGNQLPGELVKSTLSNAIRGQCPRGVTVRCRYFLASSARAPASMPAKPIFPSWQAYS